MATKKPEFQNGLQVIGNMGTKTCGLPLLGLLGWKQEPKPAVCPSYLILSHSLVWKPCKPEAAMGVETIWGVVPPTSQEPFDLGFALRTYPVRYDECLNTVLHMELGKFNRPALFDWLVSKGNPWEDHPRCQPWRMSDKLVLILLLLVSKGNHMKSITTDVTNGE